MSTDGSLRSFVPADETLTPENMPVLAARMDELTVRRLVSFVERAEMAGIWALITRGVVTAGELRKVLLTYYHISPLDGDESAWLQPVINDHIKVWQRLTNLVAGLPVEEDLSHDREEVGELSAYEEYTVQWARSAMHTLGNLASPSDLPTSEDLADLLPSDIVQRVRHRAAEEWFASPYAIGEAMQALPFNGCGAFGRDGQGVYVLDAFACAVDASLSDYYGTADLTARSKALGRVHLWSMMLKGLIFSMLSSRLGYNLAGMLCKHPDVVERVKRTLSGAAALIQHAAKAEEIFLPRWGGRLGAPSAEVTVDELLSQLDARLASEERDLSNLL